MDIQQEASALWNYMKSTYFILANRVKQGGVISTIPFYVDKMQP